MCKFTAPPLMLGVLWVATLGCGCGSTEPSAEVLAAATETVTFEVEGMTCASCSVTLRAALGKIDGVGAVEVDVNGGTATVAFDPSKTSASAIAEAITHSGYPATVSTRGS